VLAPRGCGPFIWELQRHRQPNGLERPGAEGDTPVGEGESPPEGYQSSVEPVELRVKPGGPPSKAKYYSTTDRAQVGRLKGEKDPIKGS